MNTTISTWETELTPTNASNQALPQWPFKVKILILALVDLIIALVGLAGNAAVLWLLGFRMRRNTFSIYILNLAAADFLFLCSHIMHSLLKLIQLLQSIYVYLPRFLLTLTAFPYIVGLSMLSAISTERCLSIVWPIWHHYHRPRHLSAAICALLWALSLLLSFLGGYNCGIRFEKSNHYWCETFNSIIAGWTIVLCVVLSGSSLALLFRLFCSSRRMPLTRLYATILLSVLVFLLCGLPLGILRFFLFSIQNDSLNLQNLTWTLFILSGINSSTNPIIYFFVGSFRWKRGQTLQLVLQKALDDRAEMGKLGKRIPPETVEVPASHSPSNSLSTRVHSEK
ncbi:mas-related G-protein coupled receptor member X1-like [Oryctolagus cuniculus]|uniref:mas-related G-protein coupled receptor member X1-like n=1 Tax=Oryctolagus cuniculus TaxID=9986 RepID=UPI00387991F7